MLSLQRWAIARILDLAGMHQLWPFLMQESFLGVVFDQERAAFVAFVPVVTMPYPVKLSNWNT